MADALVVPQEYGAQDDVARSILHILHRGKVICFDRFLACKKMNESRRSFAQKHKTDTTMQSKKRLELIAPYVYHLWRNDAFTRFRGMSVMVYVIIGSQRKSQ